MADREDLGTTRRISHRDGWAHVVELPAAHFVIVDGPDKGKAFTVLVSTIRIGTAADNDIVLSDDAVSRYHAKVVGTAEGFSLIDTRSKNGTFVRGVRVAEVFLEPGLGFTVGRTTIQVQAKKREYLAIPEGDSRLGALVGRSAPMQEVYALIRAVAQVPTTVLVEGESGTGKELVARAIHELSGRKGPLVAFDCGSTSPELIRSELFGHLRGAFTGASEAREGAFRRAHRGTLFLDELGDLPSNLQVNLLRVLETREVQPVGSDGAIAVDVRVVAATNQDLAQRVKQGQFRPELLHRLSVIRIRLPALRDRPEDIPLLVDHFLKTLDLPVQLSQAALEALSRYPWPGNVRMLKNVVERLGVLHRGAIVTPAQLDLPQPAEPPARETVRLEELERDAIVKALERARGNQAAAARMLGIGLTTLKRKLKEYRAKTDAGER
ncbi:MAG: sigma 54-dependent Fis family transcriptional regulator [Candidatus Riflebacteria bacterium]|nr:sigma 54-dependent Fis family transcriptional regulator [Candidatus Riflebacteria bacterium]